MPDRCGCDFPEDCIYLELGYPYCHGCANHHRAPVASPGEPCPVDLSMHQLNLELEAVGEEPVPWDFAPTFHPEDFATTGPAENPPPF